MIKTIVLDEHTLGVIYPNELQILRSSVLKGSPHPAMGTIAFHPILMQGRFRPATEKDFNDFRVVFHPQYLEELDENVTFLPVTLKLNPMDQWTVNQNLQKIETDGIDNVVNTLKNNGYFLVADAVLRQSTPACEV